jgi:hypothetical protein
MRKSLAALLIAIATGSVVATGIDAGAKSSDHGGGHSGRGNGEGAGSSDAGGGRSDRGSGGGAGSSDNGSGRSDRGNGAGSTSSDNGSGPTDRGNGAGAPSSDDGADPAAPGISARGSSAESNSSGAAGGSVAQPGVGATQGDPATGSTTTTRRDARGGRSDIELPQSLVPDGSTYGFPLQATLDSIPGTPDAVVRVCVQAIVTAAKPYGVVRVDAASSGPLRARRRGAVASLEVRVEYARQGGIEVRQSQVSCSLDAAGGVVGLT